MEFTLHISYVILELASSAVIFWWELSCCRKSYSNKVTLLLRWDHRYKHYIMKFGTFLHQLFVMSYICYLCVCIVGSWVAWLVFYKRWELLTLSRHLCSAMVFGGVCVSHLCSFLCCVFCSPSTGICDHSRYGFVNRLTWCKLLKKRVLHIIIYIYIHLIEWMCNCCLMYSNLISKDMF